MTVLMWLTTNWFFLDWLENIVEIAENTDIQHFLPFATMLQKSSISTTLKVVIVW